jgi:spore maturation protein SpmA
MALNYIWIFFFLSAFIIGLVRLLFLGDVEVFPAMINATFDMAKSGFEISLGLTGVLTLWMGIMKIGEKGGIVAVFSKLIGPFFNRLFPELGKSHPAHGSIMMNIAANMLNLDNAATPMGLKAMQEMQETNPDKNTASNAQIMFLVLNTSGLTLLPISIMVYRAQLGAVNPSDIFIPILLATYFSTMAGLNAVAFYQKINLLYIICLSGRVNCFYCRNDLVFFNPRKRGDYSDFQCGKQLHFVCGDCCFHRIGFISKSECLRGIYRRRQRWFQNSGENYPLFGCHFGCHWCFSCFGGDGLAGFGFYPDV